MDKALLVNIARMYYEKNMTQQEIANKLSLSRMSVSRLLTKAREEGVIEVKILYDNVYSDLEDKVKKKYNLSEVIITPYDDTTELRKLLSKACAKFLSEKLNDNEIVGVGWGSTLSYISNYLENVPNKEVLFVPLLGGYGRTEFNMHANQIATNLAKSFNGKAYVLHSPAMVSNRQHKEILLADYQNKFVLDFAKKIDIALIGIGAPFGDESTILESGYFNKEDINELKNCGVECDIVSSIYLDKEGNKCDLDILTRTIGISAEDFKNVPLVVAAAGGEGKHLAIKLAIESGYIDIIIIDESTAKYLLNNSDC